MRKTVGFWPRNDLTSFFTWWLSVPNWDVRPDHTASILRQHNQWLFLLDCSVWLLLCWCKMNTVVLLLNYKNLKTEILNQKFWSIRKYSRNNNFPRIVSKSGLQNLENFRNWIENKNHQFRSSELNFWQRRTRISERFEFVERCPPTQTPTQMLKSGFSIFSTKEIGSSSVSFQMVFEALDSELFRFNFHSMSSKILKISVFNILMSNSG